MPDRDDNNVAPKGRVLPFQRPKRAAAVDVDWESFEPDDPLDEHAATFASLVWCPGCTAQIGQPCAPRGDADQRRRLLAKWGVCEERLAKAFEPEAFEDVVLYLPNRASLDAYILEAARPGYDSNVLRERAAEVRREADAAARALVEDATPTQPKATPGVSRRVSRDEIEREYGPRWDRGDFDSYKRVQSDMQERYGIGRSTAQGYCKELGICKNGRRAKPPKTGR